MDVILTNTLELIIYSLKTIQCTISVFVLKTPKKFGQKQVKAVGLFPERNCQYY